VKAGTTFPFDNVWDVSPIVHLIWTLVTDTSTFPFATIKLILYLNYLEVKPAARSSAYKIMPLFYESVAIWTFEEDSVMKNELSCIYPPLKSISPIFTFFNIFNK
jgi:hypothetical protein